MATDTGWRPSTKRQQQRRKAQTSPAAQRQGNTPASRAARPHVLARQQRQIQQRQPPKQPDQRRNVTAIVHEGHKQRATRKQQIAAVATSIVEARLHNVRHGDRDSLGLFQQRPSQGWGTPDQILKPHYSARKFYDVAKRVDKPALPVGALAQSVQRSAYPARYKKQVPRAKALVDWVIRQQYGRRRA